MDYPWVSSALTGGVAADFVVVMVCWVCFGPPSFAEAGQICQHGRMAWNWDVSLDREYVIVLVVGALVATLGPTSQDAAMRGCDRNLLAVPAGAELAYLLLLIGGELPNVFIYFQS